MLDFWVGIESLRKPELERSACGVIRCIFAPGTISGWPSILCLAAWVRVWPKPLVAMANMENAPRIKIDDGLFMPAELLGSRAKFSLPCLYSKCENDENTQILCGL